MTRFLMMAFALATLTTPLHAKQAAVCTPKSTFKVPAGGIRALLHAADGKTLFTANKDGSIRVLDVASGKNSKTLSGHKGEVHALALSPDGKILASGAEDKKVILWDAHSGKQRAVLSGHENTVRGLAFSTDGKTLYSASLDKQVGSWDVAAGKLNAMQGGQACILQGIAVSSGALRDGAPAAGVACNDGLVRLWNLRSGKPQTALEGHEGEVHAVTFSPAPSDGNPPMASGDNDGKVIIWDIKAHKSLVTMENAGWTDAVRFSPDGKLLVSSGNDMAQKGLFKLWDASSGKLLNEQFPHDGNVGGISFSPDGKWLLTGSLDETVKVWDVAQLKKGCG